ncbi:hypothetical protein L1987_85455 [Smallanthus sonchifolius]|uniref:Uncharacterized protein n=1 Tax=Smallanthus sonchifolius TaxID=185202 RepID=A0ACB8XY65_9ASTR|nr:hypothetical protein L1987_85455 [Smallanthus sonchifolius]
MMLKRILIGQSLKQYLSSRSHFVNFSLWILELTFLDVLLHNFLLQFHHMVDAIQACDGQKTADGSCLKYGGGILWSILKTRDPNVFKEIMKKGKEFEKQFKQPDLRKAANQNKQMCSTAGGDAADSESRVQKDGTEVHSSHL